MSVACAPLDSAAAGISSPLPTLRTTTEPVSFALFERYLNEFSGSKTLVEIKSEVTGNPYFEFTGEMATRLKEFTVHLTLSHDAGIASAMVIVENK